jgi:hypothetical protein
VLRVLTLTAGLTLMATLVLAAPAAAQAPRLVHGADAVFVAAEAVIVWSVLRGADESSTLVVITVAPRGGAIGVVAVDGVDSLTRGRVRRGGPVPLAGPHAFRVPRSDFAEHPRTELHLAGSLEDLAAGRRVLTIDFTGVPDATPEFSDEGARAAWVAAALVGRY